MDLDVRLDAKEVKVLDGIFAAMLKAGANDKEIMSIMRKGSEPLVKSARQKAPVSSKKGWVTAHRHFSKGQFKTIERRHLKGQVKRSIGKIVSKTKDPRTGLRVLWVGPRTGINRKDDGWYANFVEFGTKGYVVKKDKVVPTPNGLITIKAGTQIRGQKPQPFMRPAWDQTRTQVITDIAKLSSSWIVQEMRKKGAK